MCVSGVSRQIPAEPSEQSALTVQDFPCLSSCVCVHKCLFPLHFLIASLSQSRLNTAENVGPGLQCTILGE